MRRVAEGGCRASACEVTSHPRVHIRATCQGAEGQPRSLTDKSAPMTRAGVFAGQPLGSAPELPIWCCRSARCSLLDRVPVSRRPSPPNATVSTLVTPASRFHLFRIYVLMHEVGPATAPYPSPRASGPHRRLGRDRSRQKQARGDHDARIRKNEP